MYFRFRTWRDFTSEYGTISLPNMARFYFRTWHDFTSEHDTISLPNMARFHFRTWRDFTSELYSDFIPLLCTVRSAHATVLAEGRMLAVG